MGGFGFGSLLSTKKQHVSGHTRNVFPLIIVNTGKGKSDVSYKSADSNQNHPFLRAGFTEVSLTNKQRS